jgi:hypothetical protein
MNDFNLSTGVHGILRNDRRETFTLIDNKTLQGEDLSYKAVGFLSKLLSLPPNWKIQVNDLMSRFGIGRFAVLERLKELQNAGYLIRQKLKDEAGRFYYVHIIRETPDAVGTVKGGRGGEVVKPTDNQGSSIVRFSVSGETVSGKPDQLINNKSRKEKLIKHPLTKQVVDVLEISAQEGKPDTIDSPIWEPTPSTPLEEFKTLEKEDLPATCDKLKLIKAHATAAPACRVSLRMCCTKRGDKTDRLTTTDRTNYQIKLAAIDVAIQNVEWVIRQIDVQERIEVVENAIAWISEQKWIQQPAAAFVTAVLTRKKSTQTANRELNTIAQEHKSVSKQFAEWFDAMKQQRLVEQSTSHPEHFATVIITEKAAQLLAQIQQQREFEELERLSEIERAERLMEMERLELAGVVMLPSYGVAIPWQQAQVLLEPICSNR